MTSLAPVPRELIKTDKNQLAHKLSYEMVSARVFSLSFPITQISHWHKWSLSSNITYNPSILLWEETEDTKKEFYRFSIIPYNTNKLGNKMWRKKVENEIKTGERSEEEGEKEESVNTPNEHTHIPQI